MEVPSRFLLKIQVFQGGAVMELALRLRYKLNNGALFFHLSFLGLEDLIRDEVMRVRDAIAADISRPVWAGTSEIR